jgi:peptide/nickel transport system permease protein
MRVSWSKVLPIVTLLFAAAVAPFLGYDPVADVHPELASQAPSMDSWLGTDHLGRSIGSRLVGAAAASVQPGLFALVTQFLLGLPIGAVAGWWQGTPHRLSRATLDLLGTLPRFVWVLLFAILYGDQPIWIGVGVGLAAVPSLADGIRSRIEDLRRVSFVPASLVHGVPARRVLLHHAILGHCRGLMLRNALETFAVAVMVEATLGYFGGFGVQEPAPSFGNLIAFSFGRTGGNVLAWLSPALCIQAIVAASAWLSGDLADRERGPGGSGG